MSAGALGQLGFPDALPHDLAGGVVAYNEEAHLRSSVRSLTDQELPDGVEWKEIWVVASGCTDRTVDVAYSLSREDTRIRVVVEPERGGKARALREVFHRAHGDALVLLNSDARAEPGAIGELLRTAAGKQPPFAVMGRPVVSGPAVGRWSPTFRWMWDLHHEIHAELLSGGTGGHLSDELLLVSLPSVPAIPDGIINDGSYLAVWLAQHAGGRWYAPEARVSIEVPFTVRDHLHQRRRIHVGNAQVTSVLREPPATLPRQFLEHPAETVRLLRQMLVREGGVGHFARLASWELAAHALAGWDRLPPRRDHVRWRRIRLPEPGNLASSRAVPVIGTPDTNGSPARLERRITTVIRAASQFGTGVQLPDLVRLLPRDGPPSVPAVRSWLETRPDLARVEGETAFAPQTMKAAEHDRRERGRRYLAAAQALFSGPLRGTSTWCHCACVTGSTAYGEPQRGDDLDLFVVTQAGALWWFLAYAYLALRVDRWKRGADSEPVPCFNFVMDDHEAAAEFARAQGFLFAREALTARTIHGTEYYAGLLAGAPWMADEIPRLYAERDPVRPTTERRSRSAPSVVRLLSLVAFPWLAAYLQFVGLRRNHRFRRAPQDDQQFRSDTRWRRLAFASRKFERLRQSYGLPTAPRAENPRSPERGADRRQYAYRTGSPPNADGT
jgi:poly-beta-1,6-N-acetyl-D-glucosamine synthase